MWVALAGLVALAVAMGIGRFAFTPLLPMMQTDTGLSLAQGGYLASANYLGYFLGALTATRMTRAGAAIVGALLAIAVSTLAMAFAEGFLAWALLRFVAGVASAWALVHVSAWVLAHAQRSVHGGVVFSGVGVGIALAGAVCLGLMLVGASSATAWAVLGVVALALTLVVAPVFRGHRPTRAAPAAKRHRFGGSDAWRLVLCYGAYGFGYIVPATYLPAMAKEMVTEPLLFGAARPLFGITAGASTLLAARWLPSLGHRGVWRLAALALAAGVAAPLVVPGLAGITAAAILVGGTFVVITMAALGEASRVAGEKAHALMAAMTTAFAAGQIVGPLAVSALLELGLGLASALAAASVLLAASAAGLGTAPQAGLGGGGSSGQSGSTPRRSAQ